MSNTDTANSTIRINGPLPGPRAQAILERRDATTVRGLYRSCPIVADRAAGATVTDVDGNVFIDLAGGIGALNAGHCPPEVTAAIHGQVDRLLHLCNIVGTYESMVQLNEKLHEIVPIRGPKKTLLCNSGVEAGENAVKIARYATGRQGIIVFEGAFHGRSLLGMTMTSKYDLYKRGFGPFASEIYRVPFPYEYREKPAGMSTEDFCEHRISDLKKALVAQIDPTSVAAVIIEPVQGEGGFIPAPPEYIRALRELTAQHGILLASDEVQTGFGRTGKMFAIEHTPGCGTEWDVDMVIMAKSIGSGLPIAAVTGKAEVMDKPHVGGLGSTYGGNPVACAGAVATIDYLREHHLADRANEIGGVCQDYFRRWQTKHDVIGDVRCSGAMCAIEFVKDRETKEPNAVLPPLIVEEAFQRGLIMIRAGLYGSCIRSLVPLVITDAQLHEAMQALGAAVDAAVQRAAAA
ncbi:aspartate aminotransferase family protein [Novipirellula rosea]|uniref:Aspartate aminotransferase family protein n=1 Tax=Novipirellula rosea TaxID=1031540 RepID=A0ABP8MME3_9BACT